MKAVNQLEIKTGRFGQILVSKDEMISIPGGVLGFPELTEYILVDPNDDTLMLWLQSTQKSEIAFAVLEPKIFRPDYSVRLSAAELRELKLSNINQSAVFSILTIPEDIALMTANLKAPLVINLKEQIAKQVVLQENEYSIKHPMFKELKSHLITIASNQSSSPKSSSSAQTAVVTVRDLSPSLAVRSLQA